MALRTCRRAVGASSVRFSAAGSAGNARALFVFISGLASFVRARAILDPTHQLPRGKEEMVAGDTHEYLRMSGVNRPLRSFGKYSTPAK